MNDTAPFPTSGGTYRYHNGELVLEGGADAPADVPVVDIPEQAATADAEPTPEPDAPRRRNLFKG